MEAEFLFSPKVFLFMTTDRTDKVLSSGAESTSAATDSTQIKTEEMQSTAETSAGAMLQIPKGYKLIPEETYDFLMQFARGQRTIMMQDQQSQKSTQPKELPTIMLRVLRPIHLGDVRTQINPNEIVEWIPNRSITIRGKKHEELGSFMSVWVQQWPGSVRYNPKYSPVFEVEPDCMQDLINTIGPPRRGSPVRGGGEAARIKREEESGRGPGRRRTAAEIEHIDMSGVEDDSYEEDLDEPTPAMGSEERRNLIIDACLGVRERGEGSEPEETSDFDLVRRSTDYKTVGRVPGPPADEAKRQTPGRKPRRERR